MRRALVYRHDQLAGELVEDAGMYRFCYAGDYLSDSALPPISLTLPKQQESFESEHCFPCFVSLLAEGAWAAEQCRMLKIDERDYFGRLLATCHSDCIGSLRIEAVE